MPKLIHITFLLLLPFILRAEVTQQLLNYIEAMAEDADFEEQGHCGFRYQFEMRRHFNELDAQHRAMVAKITQRPERQFSYVSPGGHFTFYYDTSGRDSIPSEDLEGNGVPDYIDSAAVIFENVWDVEIGQLGFQPPLGLDGNPVETYPIYFSKLSPSLYGQTWLADTINSVPGSWSTWTSYIEINTDLESQNPDIEGFDGLRVTAAHEFNHAVQLGYRVWEDNFQSILDLFFMEMTSTWLEDYVYNDVNDYYQYLPELFSKVTNTRFTYGFGLFPYGNSVYLHMIEEIFGPELVVEVWDRIRTEQGLDALDTILRQYGFSWPFTQNLYARWLYFTGSRSIPGMFFPEAEAYPELSIPSGQRLDINSVAESDIRLGAKTINYFLLENASDIRYKAKLESPSPDGYYSHASTLNPDTEPAGMNLSQAFYPGDTDTVVVALSNPLDSALTVTYTIRQDSALKPMLGPNPIVVSSNGETAHFFNLPAQSVVQIFTMNGRFVNALKTGPRIEPKLSWNLTDRFDNRLATGVYLYMITAPGIEKMGKIAVVRR